MSLLLDLLHQSRIIPVVVLDDAEKALSLAAALREGGLRVIEITFRTSAALAALERIAGSGGGLVPGAGTVLTVDQAQAAIGAGAQFIVSPGFQARVVDYCRERAVPVFPGVMTPTEIGMAAERGLSVVKFFPAEAAGGIAYLKAVSAPFPAMRFIPTGGIDEKNLAAYLALPQVAAVGGTWMVKPALIAAGNFDEITRLTAAAVALV